MFVNIFFFISVVLTGWPVCLMSCLYLVLKDYYKYTFFPRTIVHWNALPFYIPVLPTVAQFSHAVCQVVHVSP